MRGNWMLGRDKRDEFEQEFEQAMHEAAKAFKEKGESVLESMRKKTKKELAEGVSRYLNNMSDPKILSVAASVGSYIMGAMETMPDIPLVISSNDQKTIISACIALSLKLLILDGKDKTISSKL